MTSRTLVVAAFAGLLAAAVAVDLLARRPGSRLRPLGATLAVALATRTGRVAAFALWLWLGLHFLAR